jgi:hypothetical protein
MAHSSYKLLDDCKLRVGALTLTPWPDFKVEGTDSELPIILSEVLDSTNTLALLWRAKIPGDLHKCLRRFPVESLPAMLHVAQLNPAKFLDWADWCPALLGAASPFRTHPKAWEFVDVFHAFQNGWRAALELAGINPTRANLNILKKVPAYTATHANISTISQLLKSRTKERLMRHLSLIDDEVIDTLRLDEKFLDTQLLSLRSLDCFPAHFETVRELCEGIETLRDCMRLYPTWPYKGVKMSYSLLNISYERLCLRHRLGHHCHLISFAEPPVEKLFSATIKIQPLTSVASLMSESDEMKNCIQTYSTDIMSGDHYAYKLLHPERATILIIRERGKWKLKEARTMNNGRPDWKTLSLLNIWLGRDEMEQPGNDFPF